jgi:tripartite ATP-independent transporter DctM subunit
MAALIVMILLGLLFIGIPVSFSIGLSSLFYMLVTDTSLLLFPQRLVAQINKIALIATPFFIMAGLLMNSAGITTRIFRFATALVGWIPGGLGHANVIASMIFAGMSGAAVADTAGLGLIELKAMKDAGYETDFSIGVTVASSTLGPIIPPSINMIIFGSIMSVSVGSLFLGGVVPGVLCGLFMMFLVSYLFTKRKYVLTARPTFKEVMISFKGAILALMTPLIIFGGIVFGITTATEASLIAVLYALFLGIFVYRQLTLKEIWKIILQTATFSGSILLIVGMAGPLGLMFTRERVPQVLAETLLSISSNIYIIMILVVLLFVFVGTFMEVVAGIILLAPIFTPAMAYFNVDPIHFGVVLVFGMGIGLITPPVGVCLYAGSAISGLSVEDVAKATLPYLIPMMITLFLIALFPSLVLFIPRIFGF